MTKKIYFVEVFENGFLDTFETFTNKTKAKKYFQECLDFYFPNLSQLERQKAINEGICFNNVSVLYYIETIAK